MNREISIRFQDDGFPQMVVSCDRMTGPGFETISLAGNEPSSGKWVTEK